MSQVIEFISHPDKVYWPLQGYTKQDLLDYYSSISKYILPHLKNRPIMMHRFPDGIDGKSFFQKDAPHFAHDWVETVEVVHSHKTISYIVINDLQSLLYVVNLGTIDIHTFLSHSPKLENPDYLVLDLDPEDLSFNVVIETALGVHDFLQRAKIDAMIKTTGKRGMHIYIPLHAQYDFDTVQNFAELLATLIHNTMPDTTSIVRNPQKRQHKVYIDFLQNGFTKTVVSPYSVRALDHATVATPLDWKEVKKGLDPTQFTIKTVPQRVSKTGDLLKKVLGKGINLQATLKRLEKI